MRSATSLPPAPWAIALACAGLAAVAAAAPAAHGAPPAAPPARPLPTHADVSYGPHPHQLLDIHLPPAGRGPFPVLVWYGGLWDASKHVPDVNRFLPAGIAVVGVQTRTLNDAMGDKADVPISWPMDDACRAVQFLRMNAARWNIDPQRFAAGGGSQGALPALYVGCVPDRADPDATDPVLRESTRITCVAAYRSQPSIDPRRMQEWVPGVKWGAPAFGVTFDESLRRRDEFLPVIRRYSPENLVHKGAATIYFENEWGLEPPGGAITHENYIVHSPAWGIGFRKMADAAGATCLNRYPGHPTEGYDDLWDFIVKQLGRGGPFTVSRIRFLGARDRGQRMVGGRFSGSNVSADAGFQTLAEVVSVPADGGWAELPVDNRTPYRWLRYEGPPGSHGNVAEVEFYDGDRRAPVLRGFAPVGNVTQGGFWRAAFDGNPATFFTSAIADGQYTGLDLGDLASTDRAHAAPGGGVWDQPQTVRMRCKTAGATIRYTLDGTVPDRHSGLAYTAPITIDRTTTITMVAFSERLAPSPPTVAVIGIGGQRPPQRSFHVGNSLTGNASRFSLFVRTAGGSDAFPMYLIGGATTERLWNGKDTDQVDNWSRAWAAAAHPLDCFTLQPRDFDLAREVEHCARFLAVVRERSPDVQPWLYQEWDRDNLLRRTEQGVVPSSQTRAFPVRSWQEAVSAILLYDEEVQRELLARGLPGRPPRIIPSGIALAWARTLIERGDMPDATDFHSLLFDDSVHVNAAGAYLVALTWFAALYRENPTGVLVAADTGLTAEQADRLQQLAWDTVRNYPDCGLYEDGTEPCAAPEFTDDGRIITLRSATPGAWFRYTLDGTPPSRTRGSVYCGRITVQPGIRVRAIAYRSGMADSAVADGAVTEIEPAAAIRP